MAIETITWVDPAGVETTFVDLRGITGRGLPPVVFSDMSVPGQPGAVFRQVRDDVRQVVLPVLLEGAGTVAYRAALRALARTLHPTSEPGVLRVATVDGLTRELSCWYVDGFGLLEEFPDFSTPSLLFRALNPYFYDAVDNTESWALPVAGDFFPIFPMTLGSSAIAVRGNRSDDFDRPDNPTDLGAAWTVIGTSLAGIDGNEAYFSSIAAFSTGIVVMRCGPNGDFEFTVTTMANGSGAVVRWQGPNDYWLLKSNTAFGWWTLFKVVGGVPTLVTFVVASVADGVTVTVHADGSTITVDVDGIQAFSVTDATFASALNAGLYAESTAARFDNFKFTTDDGITVDGDVAVWPTWTITGPFSLVRLTLGGRVTELVYDAADGEQVVIDTAAKTVMSGDDNLYPKLTSRKIFQLQPGVNDIEIDVVDARAATEVELSYRNRWLSV